jgi:UDP-2-acetamido-2,6-beta-L-arabino-hexul-4-ose reductase
MKVLVTGCNGFIAKNLIAHLREMDDMHLYLFSKKDSLHLLNAYINEVDFIFHLAGVNRPKTTDEFYSGNVELTNYIVDALKKEQKNTPILFTSSTQVELDNDYAKSKREAEKLLLEYAKEMDASVFIYRLGNVFGKFSKPNYNSVIATWCYNITRSLEIKVDAQNKILHLLYIDDVIESFIQKLYVKKTKEYYHDVTPLYTKTLGEIAQLLHSFKNSRQNLLVEEVGSGFKRALYATYLSFLPTDKFSYKLKGHVDARGTFYEVLKTKDSGQFSLSTTAVGISRGGHYHHSKNEKFLVVRGEALIKLRGIFSDEVIEYKVSGKDIEVVEMIPGYTHNIKNIGDEELVLLMWANENFDHDKPDTYFLEV